GRALRLLGQRHARPRHQGRSDADDRLALGVAARVRRRLGARRMRLAVELRAPRRLSAEDIVMRAAILALVAFLLIAIALPLAALFSKSFQDGEARFVGLANYVRYVSTPALVASLWNSFWVAALSTAIVVPLAFLYAYGLTRTRMPAKPLFIAL